MKPASCSFSYYSKLTALVLMMGLVGCATTSNQAEQDALMAAQQAQEQADAQRQAAAEAAREAELVAQQRAQEEAAREAEARRLAEARAREEAEAKAREAAELARTQAQRQRQLEAQRVAERAQTLARQQARIAELREQIAANNTEAADLDSANDALRKAITAAEELSVVLTQEQEKYTNADPATGALQQSLSKENIEKLSAEIESLRNQAKALTSTP